VGSLKWVGDWFLCLGTDAYRFGGERVCQHTQGRTDLLDLAVWQEVCALLAQPERLAAEYWRRLHPDSPTKHTTWRTAPWPVCHAVSQ
jgi:site-specific DNA recombinase